MGDAPDEQAGHDGDHQARRQVQERDLPPKHAEKHRQGHFIDHGRRNEEGEGDAQRHSGLDKADEEGDSRTGAEGRDDAQPGGQHVAHAGAFAAQQLARALGAEKGAQCGDKEDHAR